MLDLGVDLSNLNMQRQLEELDRADCEDSLYSFLIHAWPHMDPAPFRGNWHIEAVAEHLQAVVDGDIKRLIINVPPRSSKPVREDAWVSTERGLIRLLEVKVGDNVLTHMGRFRPVTAVHEQGILPTFELTTRTGRSVSAAADHPFLTPEGWIELGKIGADDVVGVVPQYMSVPSDVDTITVEAARLLGYLVGDGCCRGTPNVTVADDIEADDICFVAESCGFMPISQAYKMANTGYMLRRISLTAPQHIHRRKLGYRGPVRQFVERHGLWGMSSYTKMIPLAVMEGSDAVVEAFVAAYWACDGFISTKGAKRDGTERDDLVIGCDSVNLNFIRDMQTLLLRLGISSIYRKKISNIKTKRQGDKYTSYSLTLSIQDDCWRFASRIKIPHTKGGKLERARKRRFDFDRIVRGESVNSVTPNGGGRCICLTVEEDSSFVANGFAVHNTSLCSVALPAWTWAQSLISPTSGPGVRFMYASYGEELSLEHSVYCRRLIKSEWYQKHWGERYSLLADQDTKHKFGNDKGGERQITSVGSRVTGRGGQLVIIDDPNATNEATSEAKIKEVTDWWDQTLRSRLNDAKTGAFVVIQQRVAEGDLTGHLLEIAGEEWEHLMIPMEYEPDRSFKSSIGWEDPRKTAGEILCPERFDEKFVASEKKNKWVFAGQYQQRPEPIGGGIIKRDWWQLWPENAYPPMDFIIASLDTAYTIKTENDYSALTVWGIFTTDTVAIANRTLNRDGRPEYIDRAYNEGAPKLMLMHAWQERLEFHDLIQKVAKTCKIMKVDKLLVENKAAGISLAQEMRRLFSHENFAVQLADPKSMDKMARLFSVQHLFEEGMIYAPDKVWAEMTITQVAQFPRGKNDDLVDTVSQAVRHLRDLGLLTRGPERLNEIGDAFTYPSGQTSPLYPA